MERQGQGWDRPEWPWGRYRQAILSQGRTGCGGSGPEVRHLPHYNGPKVRGEGIAAGTRYWVPCGLGAIVGPLVTGRVGDKWGFGPALRSAFLIETAAVLLPRSVPRRCP